jgi:hypothetical protein
LDSIDYYWADTNPKPCHQPIIDKLSIMNAELKKVSNNKFPQFDKWSMPIIDVPKQAGPSDCMFFLWKYMEFWDGEHLNIDINPVSYFFFCYSLLFCVSYIYHLCVPFFTSFPLPYVAFYLC